MWNMYLLTGTLVGLSSLYARDSKSKNKNYCFFHAPLNGITDFGESRPCTAVKVYSEIFYQSETLLYLCDTNSCLFISFTDQRRCIQWINGSFDKKIVTPWIHQMSVTQYTLHNLSSHTKIVRVWSIGLLCDKTLFLPELTIAFKMSIQVNKQPIILYGCEWMNHD